MENLSTFEYMFQKLGKLDSVLGQEIGEFMNVFKMIHGYKGEAGESTDDSIEATAMITEEMVKIYDKFLELYNGGGLTADGTVEFEVENYTSDTLPVMPKIMFMTNFRNDTANETGYRIFTLFPIEKVSRDKLKVEVEIKAGDNSASSGSELTYTKYVNEVKSELSKFVSPRVFKYFAEPVTNLDEINKSNKTSFSDDFKSLKIYSNKSSLLEYLLKFAIDPNMGNDTGLIEETELKYTDAFSNMTELLDIEDILKLNLDNSRPDNMNSLVVDVMQNQQKIENTKDRVGMLRSKLHTFISRDENYTRVLSSHRRTLMMVLVALIITAVVFIALSLTKMVPADQKAVALAAGASLWPTIHIIKVVFSMFSRNKRVKEGYLEAPEMGFGEEAGTDGANPVKSFNVPLALAHFVDKFSEVLSSEIKQEYFDALSESQEKDMMMLKQLEKEHSVSSHFHQLKNNLTHYKIKETEEFKKLTWNGILVVSLVAMLYALRLQDTISLKLFKYFAGIAGVTYTTYCLLTYKGIMLRDKQDWDRYHWVVNKLGSKTGSDSCNGLSGFARN